MQKKECPICSFTHLKVREEGARVQQKDYMQQIWIHCRVGSILSDVLGKQGLRHHHSYEVKIDIKQSIKSDPHSFAHRKTREGCCLKVALGS